MVYGMKFVRFIMQGLPRANEAKRFPLLIDVVIVVLPSKKVCLYITRVLTQCMFNYIA